MQITNEHIQYLNSVALVVVAAKEEGVIYRLADGEIARVEKLENHPPTYSDNEGFFFSGNGLGQGGAPKEENDDMYKHELDKAIAAELEALLASEAASVLYIFEPEHLKGRIEAQLKEPTKYHIHHVRYGNYLNEPLPKLVEYLGEYATAAHVDLDNHEYEEDFNRTS